MADDPPYLTVGTEVSAKYKGAFCEAKIRKVVRVVKCKVTFKAGNGSALLTDDHIKGSLRIGATVEAKHPDKNQFLEANINKIQDCSQYTVVFDDGDITTLRRSALCLKSGRHFNESETLDQLPLTHPEHFSNPVVGGRRGVRRRAADKDESSDEEDDEVPAKAKDGKKKFEKESDMGKVVCVDSTDKKKSKDTWFPALVVSPSAQETAKIRIKDEYLVRSFRDGRYYTVPKKEITEFTKDSMSKYDSNSNVLRSAVDKALQFLDKNELPPHWDREVLFGNARQSESGEGEDQQSESEASEDDPRNEEKDRFIAQLYKFMDDRGTPMNKVPQINNRDLDLHKLYKTVTGKAGYNKVTSQGQWKSVTMKLACWGNMPSTSTINQVKQAYKKYLHNFEEFDRKLGYTWTPRTTSTSKSRSSRSIFRERTTPSSSRESTRDSKKGGDDDDSSTTSSKRGDRETKEKPSSATKEKEKDTKEEEKEKVSASPETNNSPVPGDTGSETSEVQKQKETVDEPPRKSSRGRQPKKDRDADESASPSSSTASRKKRQTNASSASRERERDSSVASSTKEDGPPTSSSSSTPVGKKGTGTGRGKYKRNSTKSVEPEEKEKEPKVETKPEEISEEPTVKKMTDIRVGDKLQVNYPKSDGKTYEAKVIDINEKNESFLVHYTGWNNRYDEWIDRARVSENTTLKLELSGETDVKSASSSTTTAAKDNSKAPGVKQRKGRNSSSATSNTSASSTTTAPTTPSATRSGANKSNPVVAPPTTPTTGSKRRRSTSTEIVTAVPAPKRRRTRQKSGQDSQPSTAASESELETSDSDGRSIKSDKIAAEPPEIKKGSSESITPTPTATSKMLERSLKKTEDKEPKSGTVEPAKNDKKQPELIDLEDDLSSSSVTSTKSKDAGKSSTVVEDSKESTSSSGSSCQVIDLNQIRLEMKGLEKMVKGSPTVTTTQQLSPTPASVSSPAPPTLSAVVGSSPPPPEPTKVDIYEFQEDGSDETAPPPITPSAPKLKMFSPAARATTVAVEKTSPTVSATSAEAVAKLQLSQEQEKTPVPIVALEKVEGPTKPAVKPTVTESQSEPTSVKPVVVSPSPILVSIKDFVKTTTVAKDITISKPSVVASVVSTPLTLVAATPIPAPVVSVSLQSTPPLPVLTSPAPPPVVLSSPLSAPSLVAVTTATTLTPVIISTTSKTITKVGAAQKITAFPSTPVAARISLTSASSPQSSPPVLVPSSLLTSSPSAPAVVSTPSVVTLTPVIPSSSAISVAATSSALVSSSIVTSPPPPVLLQQQPVRPLLSTPAGVRPPVITISSPISTSAPTFEKVHPPVVATVGSGRIKAIIPPSYPTTKTDIFPQLIQQSSTIEVTSSSSIPTISIISATSLKPIPSADAKSDIIKSSQISTLSQSPQISTVQQPTLNSSVPQQVQVSVSTVPPPSQTSTVLQSSQVSTVPQPTLISTSSPQTSQIQISTASQLPQISTAPQLSQISIPQSPQLVTVSQPTQQVSTIPQPIKVVATIPPPPPIVVKPVTTTAPSIVKPMFGPGPVGITPAPIDTPKQKKKKAKALGLSTTPVKTLAPLPTSGAPPPPPVIVSMSSATSSVSSVSITPTPGRKTPVKKRIPPPMDSPGKPIKSVGTPGMPSKPGKMNSEAMNAAIASVGAATPPTIAVPTTVITSTSSLFQGHSGPGGVIFATTTGTPPPPPTVNISKTSIPTPIKSSSESIAASIAAVASGNKSTQPLSAKSGMPTKRFMKDSSSDKFGMNKDKLFPVNTGPPPLSTPQGPPPPIVIGKALEPQHSSSQQSSHQPPPPPITIQAKFQQAHPLTGPGIPTGPAVTFVKTSQSGPPQGGSHHHSMDHRQIHPQSNIPKNPVIFLPSSNPIVVKQAFHNNLQPIIMTKPMQVEGPPLSVSSSQPTSQPTSVLVTAAPSSGMMKSTMLPITVTPSNVQVTSVPVSFASMTMTPSSVGGTPLLTTGPHPSQQQQQQQTHSSVLELKPVTTADLPPSITVTKATTVMKSISPDIVAVSSYNSSMRNTSFTPVKPEERSVSKEPEIVVKPAPASAQIVFHTAAESRKVEVVQQQHPPKQVAHHHHSTPPPPPPVVVTAPSKIEPEENSLLCEEIIPGSPTTGEDAEDKMDDEEKDTSLKKKVKLEDVAKSSKQAPPAAMEPVHVPTPPPPVLPPAVSSGPPLGSGGKPVIVLGPKFGEDALEEEGFVFEDRSTKFEDDDDNDNKMEERSVDSPMGPPSEGREADLPFRDSFSETGDHSPPSSPSTTSTISTDNSSRRHHRASRLSPTPEGGSSKSKDSDDDEDIDSDVGSKSTHLDDADSKHGSTRGSTRIRNQSSRLGRSPSPPTSKRRRMMNRRNKSPEEARYTPRTIRTSSGRKVTPVGRHGESLSEREEKVKQPPPPPPVNLAKPPKTGRYNFIPNINGMEDPEQRIALISQAINDLKDQYQKTKNEAASFDRRVKRWKRRVREKERLARQEATRAAS